MLQPIRRSGLAHPLLLAPFEETAHRRRRFLEISLIVFVQENVGVLVRIAQQLCDQPRHGSVDTPIGGGFTIIVGEAHAPGMAQMLGNQLGMQAGYHESDAVKIVVKPQPAWPCFCPARLQRKLLPPKHGIVALRAIRCQKGHDLRVHRKVRRILLPVVSECAEILVGVAAG